jgi:hypothetical protein
MSSIWPPMYDGETDLGGFSVCENDESCLCWMCSLEPEDVYGCY